MNLLKKFLCTYFGYCEIVYNQDDEHLIRRYAALERRTDRLWKPRDLLDIR